MVWLTAEQNRSIIYPLPPNPKIENDTHILKKLVSADRALATVNSRIMRYPDPLMLVNTIALQEAKASTAIKNIFTTEAALYKAVSDTLQEDKQIVPFLDTSLKKPGVYYSFYG